MSSPSNFGRTKGSQVPFFMLTESLGILDKISSVLVLNSSAVIPRSTPRYLEIKNRPIVITIDSLHTGLNQLEILVRIANVTLKIHGNPTTILVEHFPNYFLTSCPVLILASNLFHNSLLRTKSPINCISPTRGLGD